MITEEEVKKEGIVFADISCFHNLNDNKIVQFDTVVKNASFTLWVLVNKWAGKKVVYINNLWDGGECSKKLLINSFNAVDVTNKLFKEFKELKK